MMMIIRGHLYCVALLFWNLLAFLLLLIAAHLLWHLGENYCDGYVGAGANEDDDVDVDDDDDDDRGDWNWAE